MSTEPAPVLRKPTSRRVATRLKLALVLAACLILWLINGYLLIELALWLLPVWLVVGSTLRNQHEGFGIAGCLMVAVSFVFGLFLGFLLTGILLPISCSVMSADGRMRLASQGHELMIAIHNYHQDHKKLPPATLLSPEGKPLLSWRVVILPYLGHNDLYKQFHLDEPWDSAHNVALLAHMPSVYRSPAWCRPAPDGETYFQLFVGPGAAFEVGRDRTLEQVKAADGLGNTVFAGWAEESVLWTKPHDLDFAAGKPMPALGAHGNEFPFPIHLRFVNHPGEAQYYTVFVGDGSVRRLRASVDHKGRFENLRPFVTWNGGEKVDWDEWD